MRASFDRREFLTRLVASQPSSRRHISSVLVHVLPEHKNAVVDRLSRISGAEVHGEASGKIIVVLEAENADVIGGRVLEMTLLEGVIAASLVYEQSYEDEAEGTA
jgi:periplasmic nitrate reductase NapD